MSKIVTVNLSKAFLTFIGKPFQATGGTLKIASTATRPWPEP
jgi:hypothetical protein